MDFIKMLSTYRTHLMGCAMVIIILLHQMWLMDFPFWIFHGMGHYGVDVFFFVSGFGLWFSLEKNDLGRFYKNRFFRLLPLCIVAGIIKTIMRISFYGFSMDLISLDKVLGVDLWFIQGIIVFYLLAPLIYRLLIRFGVLVFWIVIVGSSLALLLPLEMFPFLLSISRFPVFVLGMAIANGRIVVDRFSLPGSFFSLIVAVLFNLLYCHGDNGSFESFTFDYIILCLGIPSLCVLLFVLLRILKSMKIDIILEWIGQRSLEFYLCHEFIFGLLDDKASNSRSSFLVFALAISITFGTVFVLHQCSSLLNRQFK